MLSFGNNRISSSSSTHHHLRESNHHQIQFQYTNINNYSNMAFGSCYTKTLSLGLSSSSSSFSVKLGRRHSSSIINCVQPNSSHTQIPLLSDCLRRSQSEDSQEPPSERMAPIAGGIVALGKFDALHIGHRELAIQAAKMGFPYLLSFVGMAEVLGWEPRAPIVAKCDRKRVLSLWSPLCGGMTPKEFEVEFLTVRSLSPRQFVEKLSKELGVQGVVAGQNYRFGYRASGNASDLIKLCGEHGMQARIINSIMDKNQDSKIIDTGDSKEQGQVSSTRVRLALVKGDMKYVSELLGRHHRLILATNDQDKRLIISRNRVSAPLSCLLNLPPKQGVYDNCLLFIGDNNVSRCRVMIETTHIHLELDDPEICTQLTSQDTNLLGIEFGE